MRDSGICDIILFGRLFESTRRHFEIMHIKFTRPRGAQNARAKCRDYYSIGHGIYHTCKARRRHEAEQERRRLPGGDVAWLSYRRRHAQNECYIIFAVILP